MSAWTGSPLARDLTIWDVASGLARSNSCAAVVEKPCKVTT
jgi:hypothetical protein